MKGKSVVMSAPTQPIMKTLDKTCRHKIKTEIRAFMPRLRSWEVLNDIALCHCASVINRNKTNKFHISYLQIHSS
uniref:Uncharacterized protein n=1 Tax=Rhizophora mucronata TaxID=61149 RepID=A0A2P2Q8J8_RHIMU